MTISEYNIAQKARPREICEFLEQHIQIYLKKSESQIWHGSPVWFIGGNPVVSYSVRKNDTVSLMFFSGQSFEEKELIPLGKFKAAEIRYTDRHDVRLTHLKRWLQKAKTIQWDYKNIVKMKGVLIRLNI
ncbi:MAG: hypothetical protein RI996_27 [Candidatus Parcubacteria bacterium]|jgi:hypothetical protein